MKGKFIKYASYGITMNINVIPHLLNDNVQSIVVTILIRITDQTKYNIHKTEIEGLE